MLKLNYCNSNTWYTNHTIKLFSLSACSEDNTREICIQLPYTWMSLHPSQPQLHSCQQYITFWKKIKQKWNKLHPSFLHVMNQQPPFASNPDKTVQKFNKSVRKSISSQHCTLILLRHYSMDAVTLYWEHLFHHLFYNYMPKATDKVRQITVHYL